MFRPNIRPSSGLRQSKSLLLCVYWDPNMFDSRKNTYIYIHIQDTYQSLCILSCLEIFTVTSSNCGVLNFCSVLCPVRMSARRPNNLFQDFFCNCIRSYKIEQWQYIQICDHCFVPKLLHFTEFSYTTLDILYLLHLKEYLCRIISLYLQLI